MGHFITSSKSKQLPLIDQSASLHLDRHLEGLHSLYGIDGTRLAVPHLNALVIPSGHQAVVVCGVSHLIGFDAVKGERPTKHPCAS